MGQQDQAILNLNQYENDAVSCSHDTVRAKFDHFLQNWQSHVKWTGPQIYEQLPSISVICAGMGTTGTMTGLGQYFKTAKPSVTRLGYVDLCLPL
jgi:cysteine synthase